VEGTYIGAEGISGPDIGGGTYCDSACA